MCDLGSDLTAGGSKFVLATRYRHPIQGSRVWSSRFASRATTNTHMRVKASHVWMCTPFCLSRPRESKTSPAILFPCYEHGSGGYSFSQLFAVDSDHRLCVLVRFPGFASLCASRPPIHRTSWWSVHFVGLAVSQYPEMF